MTRKATRPRSLQASETSEHIAVADWLRAHRVIFIHCPNERVRRGPVGPWIGHLKKLERMGVAKGFPDFLIFDRPPELPQFVGATLELKVKGRKPGAAQDAWLSTLGDHGWIIAVANGAGAAIKVLEAWGYGNRR